jgi:hypothetical protein
MKKEFCMVLVLCLAIPVALAQESQPTAEDLPTADQILDKFVEAQGGKPALERINSRVSEGTFEVPEMGAGGSITIYAKAPNKTAVVVEVPGFGTITQGVDGEEAWEDNPMSGITVRSGAALAAAKRDAIFHRELNLKDYYSQVEMTGKRKIGDQEVYVLQLTPEEGDPESWFFDAETGLLARVEAIRESPQGAGQVQVTFKDYREVEGIKTAFLVEQVLPGMTIVTRLTEVRHNVEIDDARFAKP